MLGMNVGGWNSITTGQDVYWQVDVDELWSLGVRKVRLGGTDPAFTDAVTAQKALALRYKARGFYVEIGLTKVPFVSSLTTTTWPAHRQAILDFAQWCQDNGMDAFMTGNEEELHNDNTTITDADIITLYKGVAADAQAIFSGKVVYNASAGDTVISAWNAAGITPGVDLDQVGFNLYGSSYSNTASFQSQVNSVVNGLGTTKAYVSEWNMYYDWTTVTFDQELQQRYIGERLSILEASGLDHFFWTWKNHNVNVPSEWNYWALKTTTGTPTETNQIWQKRSFYYTFFPTTYQGAGKRGLAFDGSHDYATTPIIPAGTGISIGFWYNRQRYHTGEEYIIGNLSPSDNYINGFRMFHDANSKDLVVHTKPSSGGQFLTKSRLNVGEWTHIALTTISGSNGATLYLNGEPYGTLQGYIGIPTRAITIGARAGDNILRGQFFMYYLAMQNTSTPWTQQQVVDLMNKNIVPTGGSFYNFSHNVNDLSGNNNNLTLVNGSYSVDVPLVSLQDLDNNFARISNYLKFSLIPNISSIRGANIYDHELTDLAGFPSVTITVQELAGRILDNARNERVYRFTIRVFIDRKNFGSQKTESVLRTVADEFIDKLDADPTLGGNCIDSIPFPAKFGYIDRESNDIRLMEVQLDARNAITWR